MSRYEDDWLDQISARLTVAARRGRHGVGPDSGSVPGRLVAARLRGLVLASILAVPITVLHTLPVAADCGSDGITWPTRPDQVQGLTFTGTPVERLTDSPEPGAVAYHFKVDHVFSGLSDGSVVLVPWCVATPFTLGERYLVSTSDRLPLPGFEADVTDGQAWFTGGASVAWRIGPAAAVTLLGYDEAGGVDEAPAFLREATTIAGAVEAVLGPGAPYQGFPIDAASPSVAPILPEMSPGVD